MSRVYLLTLLCSLFIVPLMTSCESEEALDIQTEFVEKTGADYLNSYFTPNIMYHYVHIDHQAEVYSGWMVDNKGNIRTYKLDYQAFNPNAFEITRTNMEELLEQTEVLDVEVDLDVLVEQYKRNVIVAREDLETMGENPDATTSSTFYSYSLSYGRDLESCGARSHNDRFQQTILKSDGKVSLENKSHLTKNILDYLAQVRQSQGL